VKGSLQAAEEMQNPGGTYTPMMMVLHVNLWRLSPHPSWRKVHPTKRNRFNETNETVFIHKFIHLTSFLAFILSSRSQGLPL